MKPNGLVEAASTTSQTSIPIRSQSWASSLTSAMLTERKMFSSSFVSSAASGEETVDDLVADQAVELDGAPAALVGVSPPTTFGVVRIVWSVRPGSIRSGEKARLKSLPAREPRLLEDRQQPLAGRARVGGRLEHHQLALARGRATSWVAASTM